MEWFLKQSNSINGFVNHNWNGITTKAFGEIVYSIIINDIKIPNSIHVIPKNYINKYDLLKLFRKKFKKKIIIKKFKAEKIIDRSLSTKYPNLVKLIWKETIFKGAPSIQKMINLM